jgi:hypothetical protein
MASLSDIEASIRAGTDHDTDTQVTTPQIYAWFNEAYAVFHRRLATLFPDLFTKISADVPVASGASSFDLTATPPTLTDFGKLRVVQVKSGLDYFSLPLANAANPEREARLCFRQRGFTTIDLFPTLAAAGTYRVRYVTKGLKLAAPTDPVDLPEGAETVLIETVAARVRCRHDDDPGPHMMFKSEAWKDLLASLGPMYVSTPQSIQDIRGRF